MSAISMSPPCHRRRGESRASAFACAAARYPGPGRRPSDRCPGEGTSAWPVDSPHCSMTWRPSPVWPRPAPTTLRPRPRRRAPRRRGMGVVVDDAAVTPQYVKGLEPARELPIIWRITKGSLRNKLVFILPVLLLLSVFAPWALTPILMLGGLYLSFEGAEKIWELVRGRPEQAPAAARGAQAEDRIVSSAVRTDLILSAEIMVISMDSIDAESLWARAAVLVVVAIGITAVVYGAVGLLVKMDD